MQALPDLISSGLMSRYVVDTQNALNDAAQEAITGRRIDVADATRGQIGNPLRAQRLLDQASSSGVRLSLGAGRLAQASESLEAVRLTVVPLSVSTLQAARASERSGVETSAESARSLLDATVSSLNTRFDNRYVFGGDDAASAPLTPADDLLALVGADVSAATTQADKLAAVDAFFAPGGGFESSVYRGGIDDAAPLTLPDSSVVPATIRADADGVRDLLKGLVLVSLSETFGIDDARAWMEQGATLIKDSESFLIEAEAAIGNGINRIEAAQERELRSVRLAEEALYRMVGRDQFEAASRVQALEGQLEAIYALVGRLGRLSLVNFLR